MKRKYLSSFLLALGLLVVSINPVGAISDPNSVTIGDAYVFRDVIETGDQLYYVRYDVEYTVIPDEDAEDTWEVALYDSTDTLIASRALPYYQHYMVTVYLNASQALTWEAAHKLVVRGSPALFSLIEGTNQKTRTLSAGDYYEASSLSAIILTQAGILETDWGITLLGSTGKLNSTGASIFNEAIPGLGTMIPNAFETTLVNPVVDYTAWNTSYQDTIGTQTSSLKDAAEGIGQIFGITSTGWSEFWIASLAFMLFAGAVFVPTGNPMFAMVVAFPVAAGLAFLGLGGGQLLQLLLVVVLILAVAFAIYFILGRFA